MTEKANAQAVLRMISGAWVAQALFVAAKLGIADLLREGPKSPDALAQASGAHPMALNRILRALASVGVFAADRAGDFRNTPLSEFLRSDRPDSIRPFAVMAGSKWIWQSWGEIMHSALTEEPAFNLVHGTSFFDYLARHPEAQKVFSDGLTSRSRPEDSAVVAAYDFSGAGTVVDVAGGQGSLLASILAANPALRGILFEMPEVVAMARQTFDRHRVSERCTVVAGDLFASVPAGGDVYLIKKVIHDFKEAEAETILRIVRKAVPAHGRLLVIENVIPEDDGPAFGKLLDLLMLVGPGGRERTEAEYRHLFAAADFTLTRIIATGSPVSIIEAAPA